MSSVRVVHRIKPWAQKAKATELEGGVFDIATDAMRLSKMFNPIDLGDLRDSHLVERVKPLHYRVSANTPYARRQHFEHKRKARYLERAGDIAVKSPERHFRR